MYDTVLAETNLAWEIPKRMRHVLEKYKVSTSSLTGPQMKQILSKHTDQRS